MLKRGKRSAGDGANDAMKDERAQALRDMGAEVVVAICFDLDSDHRVMAGWRETMSTHVDSDATWPAPVQYGGGGEAYGREGSFQYVADGRLSQMSSTETTPEGSAEQDELERADVNWSVWPVGARAADSVSRRLIPDFHSWIQSGNQIA